MRAWLLGILMLTSTTPVQAADRILALSPHACEMLYAIGAAAQIAGAVSYCDYPAAAKQLPRIGSYQGVNVEAALRLQPDAAVVLNRHVKGVEQLSNMGVTIIVSDPHNMEEVFRDIDRLGRLTGHAKQAQQLVAAQRKRLQQVRRQAAKQHVRVFYELWPDPLLTAGGLSFINALITEAGGNNVFAAIPMDTPHVNVESVIRAKPQVIIIPLEKRKMVERRRFWRRWLHKDSVTFAAINPDILHRPGPRLIDGVEQLQRIFTAAADRK